MTKAQVIAELRRKAVAVWGLSGEANSAAWDVARDLRDFRCFGEEWLCDLRSDDLRTYFLLVAAALEAA